MVDLFQRYAELDISDKKSIAIMITPTSINKNGDLSLELDSGLEKILVSKSNYTFKEVDSNNQLARFTNRKISIKRVINILTKKNITVSENEARVILELLYIMAKTYRIHNSKSDSDLKWTSNREKRAQRNLQLAL